MQNVVLPTLEEIKSQLDSDSIRQMIAVTCNSEERRACDWESTATPDSPWISVAHQQVAKRQQGWKLHISAALPTAEQVLNCVLPILLAEPTCFKVAASLHWLAEMNEGRAGLSQVGKFITIYPVDDQQAIRLAVKLDEATRGLRGPALFSDRALRPGSLVHYRYGSFIERWQTTSAGTFQPVIATTSGEWSSDRRLASYQAPVGVDDPFLATGCSVATPHPSLLQERYLLVGTIHRSVRGCVYEAVDMHIGRRCVLKQAYRDGALDRNLRDARDMLRNEVNILTRLQDIVAVPEVSALFVQDDDLWFAMEYVDGVTLERFISTLSQKGEQLPLPKLLSWANIIAEMLEQLHQHHIIYRDLKSLNTLVTTDNTLYFLDFGLAVDLASPDLQFHGGTHGYSSPQQIANAPANVTDDIYSFGAMLYLLATGAEPSLAPDEYTLLNRPIHYLHPGLPDTLCDLIARCLAQEPGSRFASMGEVMAALQTIGQNLLPTTAFAEAAKETERDEQQRWYEMARAGGEALAKVVETTIQGQGPTWALLKPSPGSKLVWRDLGNGMAGVLFALTDFVVSLDASTAFAAHLRMALRDGAYWLLRSTPIDGTLLPGLYSGEAGVGIALLRAGQVLEDQVLISGAEERGKIVDACPYLLPDLFHGTAGRLKFHLWLWQVTGKDEHLAAALRAGDSLIKQASATQDGGLYWRIAEGHGELSGLVYTGYAHGVAGIADALLDLYEASGNPEWLDAFQKAYNWLMQRALPVGADQQGLGWPRIDGGTLNSAFWCHGSGGIARLLLHAAHMHVLPESNALVVRAGCAVAQGTRWAGPSRCHGLAGSIELLLDLYEQTGEQEWLQTAWTFGHLLEAYAIKRDGRQLWLASDEPGGIVAGLQVGFAGIAATLLRLSLTLPGLWQCQPADRHLPRLF